MKSNIVQSKKAVFGFASRGFRICLCFLCAAVLAFLPWNPTNWARAEDPSGISEHPAYDSVDITDTVPEQTATGEIDDYSIIAQTESSTNGDYTIKITLYSPVYLETDRIESNLTCSSLEILQEDAWTQDSDLFSYIKTITVHDTQIGSMAINMEVRIGKVDLMLSHRISRISVAIVRGDPGNLSFVFNNTASTMCNLFDAHSIGACPTDRKIDINMPDDIFGDDCLGRLAEQYHAENDISYVCIIAHGDTMNGEPVGAVSVKGNGEDHVYYTDIFDYLSEHVPGVKVIFLLNCYSGTAFDSMRSIDIDKQNDYFVFASSMADLTSGQNIFQMWFSHDLSECIENGVADSNGDGAFSFDELSEYLPQHAQRNGWTRFWASYYMSPVCFRTLNMAGEQPIFAQIGQDVFYENTSTVTYSIMEIEADNKQSPEASTITTIPKDAITFDGHSYKVFTDGMNWHEAKDYCDAVGGHLATITTAAEQDFIESLILDAGKNFYWIGGYHENNETWQWITGEQWDYTNWSPGEPNNEGRNESALTFIGRTYDSTIVFGRWNDLKSDCDPNGFYLKSEAGFICEWDGV